MAKALEKENIPFGYDEDTDEIVFEEETAAPAAPAKKHPQEPHRLDAREAERILNKAGIAPDDPAVAEWASRNYASEAQALTVLRALVKTLPWGEPIEGEPEMQTAEEEYESLLSEYEVIRRHPRPENRQRASDIGKRLKELEENE